ncbi:TonB family protein [Desulfovibrio sp.]|uniref:TonB family protein n=1 Tax=Desulfovibrio sp. TaxID=885 RepID=UPI0025C3DAB3|nr:TonB family protein [Desulfovibrio sp.]
MPSQPRTNLSSLCICSSLIAVTFFYVTAVGAFAASAASADQSTYAGNMLDKIIEIWAPPPALKSDFRVRLKVTVNGRGQVEDCKPVKSSGLEAFDSSVCGAVQQIGSFGTPPYGAPMDVHLTFWNGTPKGKPKPETLSSEEALRAEVKARNKAEAALGDTRAEAAEDRARERAEAIAKASGKNAPEVRPAPVAPAPAPKANAESKKKGSKAPATAQADSAPATQLIGRSSPTAAESAAPAAKENPARQVDNLPTYGDPDVEAASAAAPAQAQVQAQPKAQPPAKTDVAATSGRATVAASGTPASGATTSGTTASGASGVDRVKYRRDATRQIRDAILIPAETEPGEYQTRLRLTISPQGEITDFKVISPTGDKLLDKYVQRGIRRAGSLPPPPAELGGTLDITLTLVRR